MKTKHIKQVLISNLILVIFLLSPSAINSQTEYKNGQGEVMGTSDSRLVASIVESGDIVQLQITALGPMLADGIHFDLLYNPSSLALVNASTFSEIAVNADPYSSVKLETSFLYNGYNLVASQHLNKGSFYSLSTYSYVSATRDRLELPAGEIAHIYTVYFKKKTTNPLSASDFGFFNNEFPLVTSGWVCEGYTINYIEEVPMYAISGYFGLPELFAFNFSPNVDLPSTTTSGKIAIYPNPTSGAFTIDLTKAEPAYRYELLDAKGTLVSESAITGNLHKVNVKLSAGVYYVRIYANSGVFVETVIIRH